MNVYVALYVLALDLLCIYSDEAMWPRHVFRSNGLNIDEGKSAQKTSRIFPCLYVIYSYDKPSCAMTIHLEFPNRYMLIVNTTAQFQQWWHRQMLWYSSSELFRSVRTQSEVKREIMLSLVNIKWTASPVGKVWSILKHRIYSIIQNFINYIRLYFYFIDDHFGRWKV